MKKAMNVILAFTLMFALIGCGQEINNEPITGSGNYYVLPDLNGKTTEEIIEIMVYHGQAYEIIEFDQENEIYENMFIMYSNYDTGDFVDKEVSVEIVVYPEFTGTRTRVRLPNIEGLNEEQITDIFSMYELNVSFSYTELLVEEDQGLFSHYGSGYEVGDVFYLTSNVSVILYEFITPDIVYFEPIEIEYDGPLLNEEYADVDLVNPRGGYFDTTLEYCIDGDTAKFDYPDEVYDEIYSYSKTTRFLNMDTEESTNTKEEWGKPGSLYTCSLLTEAVEIRLQTDPGHGIVGNYGRLLAWVWIKLPGEEEFFLLNYMVVQQGLAQVKYGSTSELGLAYDGLTYNDWMLQAERYAQTNELGQWGELLDYYWDYENDLPYYERW